LVVKNRCFLLGGHRFKSEEVYSMYTPVDLSNQIIVWSVKIIDVLIFTINNISIVTQP
jgi:hypothetical protein